MPTIDLTEIINPVEYEPTESYKEEVWLTNLTDGYEQLAISGSNHLSRNWSISKTNLTVEQRNDLESVLLELQGTTSFLWSPVPSQIPKNSYVCKQFTFNPLAPDPQSPKTRQYWRLQAVFEVDKTGQCEAFRNNIDKALILSRLNRAVEFMNRYTHDVEPMFANSSHSPRNNFHLVLGRGGYLHPFSSTSESVFTCISACCEAFKTTGNIKYKEYALEVANYALTNLYPKVDPFSYTEEDKFLCHWLTNAGSSFPTQGKTHPTDYFRNGYKNINVSFTNGVGVLQTSSDLNRDRLANVYLAYTGKLYFESIYSPTIPGSGQTYPIDYWVSNQFMQGTKFRIYSGSGTSAGQDPEPTNEQVGTIRLTSNYTGTLKVNLTTYNTEVVPRNARYDAYPAHRSTYPNEYNFATDVAAWADDSFNLLAEIDSVNATKWRKCAELNHRDYLKYCVNVPNLPFWAKKDEDSDPFAYAGTQIVSVRSGQTVTDNYIANRVTNSASNLYKFVRIDYTSTAQNTYPSIEYQNYAAKFIIAKNSKIVAEIASTRGYLYELTLSTSSNPFDFSKLFIRNWLIDGGSVIQQGVFDPESFVRWGEPGKQYLVWHPTIVDFPNPLYVYSGEGGTATKGRAREDIPVNGKLINNVAVWRSVLTKGEGFAGFGYVVSEGKKIRKPPRFFYKIEGQVTLKIKDGKDKVWTRDINSTNGWVKKSFDWSDFEGDGDPDSESPIQNIEFEVRSDTATVWSYWIAENERNEPQLLSSLAPVKTYKGAIVARIPNENFTLYVGDFYPTNTPSSELPFKHAPIFTVNIINNNIDAWLGAGCPLIGGYTLLYHLWDWGAYTEFDSSVDALVASQAEYAKRVGVVGPFAQYYVRDYWDSNEFAQQYGDNVWIERGVDPSGAWIGYQCRTIEWAARAFHANPTNSKVREIVRKFLSFIDQHFLRFNTNRIPTLYPLDRYPPTDYHEPHGAALVMRSAIYANLGGISPTMTYRIIHRCLEYIESQWVSSGSMEGSWSLGQPTFITNNVTYRQWFSFWEMEIVKAMCLLYKYRDQLTLPACQTKL